MLNCQNIEVERQTILGLKLLLLTGLRSGELRFSEPWQFDLKNKLWHDRFQLRKSNNNK